MALIDNLENLPTGVKYAAAGGAALGLLALIYRKGREANDPNNAPQVARPGVTTPYILPPGAATGSGQTFGQTDTPSLEFFTNALQAMQEQNAQNLAAILALQQGSPANGTGGVANGNQAGGTAPDPPPVTGEGNAAAPAPSAGITEPAPSPVPQQAPQPTPAPAPTQSPLDRGDTMFLADLKPASFIGGSGDAVQRILDWLQGSKAKIYATFTGSDWKSYGRAEAGWVDENIGLFLPVAYNGTHDYGVGDYTNESYYARWARKTIDIMRSDPSLSQKKAGLMAASALKRDMTATGVNFYNSGFDMGSVPDNYGYGQYWR